MLGALAVLVFVRSTPSDAGALVFLEVLFTVLGVGMTVEAAYFVMRLTGSGRGPAVEVALGSTEVKRGEPVQVHLILPGRAHAVHKLQVGLVCTRFSDLSVSTGTGTRRSLQRVDVVSDWRDVTPGENEQSFQFTVESTAPFSYEGGVVSWAYRVSVRRLRRKWFDSRRDVAIWVRP